MFTKEGASFNDLWNGEAQRRRETVRQMMMVMWLQYDRYRPIPWKRSSSRPGEPGAFRGRLETRSHKAENGITMDLRRLDAFATYCIVIEALVVVVVV